MWDALLSQLNGRQRKVLKLYLYCMVARSHYRRRVPRFIKFYFFASLLSFGLLAIMPMHPLSMPAALGGGFALALVAA